MPDKLKTMKSHYVVTFVKDKNPQYQLPQCGCGRIVRQYYEIEDYEERRFKIMPSICEVICKKCFEKLMKMQKDEYWRTSTSLRKA